MLEQNKMRISKAQARDLFRAAAADSTADPEWLAKINKLSQLCEDGTSKTHIAFLGTAILAKAIDPEVDLYYIKPNLAPDHPKAYSARTLCHSVLVPLAGEFGINIGVTGREPLNNQPYFRMTYLGDDTPVHHGGKAAFDYMVQLVNDLQLAPAMARTALAAFIQVRRRHQRIYVVSDKDVTLSADHLVAAIEEFVRSNSEGGRRAQAVAAGLIDVFAGAERVESGRINDPSRKAPGDVCVAALTLGWEKAFEVRDKPVSLSDVKIFARKCADMGVMDAAVLMANANQPKLEAAVVSNCAQTHGVGITLFYGWANFIQQVLFWAEPPTPDAAIQAVKRIADRLEKVEVEAETITLWHKLTSARYSP